MIRVDRSRVRPDEAWLARAERGRQRLAEQVGSGAELRFDPHLGRDVRPALAELFASRCAYCESPITDAGHAELFRPRAMAVDLDGATTRPGYWWLACTWENLYLACAECNRNKGNRFPVAGPRARTPEDDLAAEGALLLDPCAEDPEQHLLFNEEGLVASASPPGEAFDRGAITIDVLGLNRPALVEARRQAAAELQARGHVDENAPYVALQRQLHGEDVHAKQSYEGIFLYQQAHEEDLRRSSVAHNVNREALQSQAIRAIEIANFRGIDHLELEFGLGDGESSGWTMLLGENGVGKSSVLQALALALMGAETSGELAEIDPSDLLRRGTSEGHIRLSFSADSEPLEVRLTPDAIEFPGSGARPRMILLGFGSSRWLPRPGGFPPDPGEFVRVRNLFNPFVPLADTIAWLAGLGDEEFAKTEDALLRLLQLEAGHHLSRADGDVLVCAAGEPVASAVRLTQLSDGYQSVIAMVGDIMELLSPKRIDMAAAEGLVLIDEIGSHLHPRWKMQAVARLREAFPRLQFVATTHEPLCLRGMRDRLDRVVVMRRDSGGRVVTVPDLPSVEALRVDQLLTSPHFGLHSTMDEATEARFDEYYRLLAQPSRTPEQERRLGELRADLDTRDFLGADRRERMMLEAIDAYLAREADALKDGGQPLLKQETSDRLASILDEGGGTP